MPFFITCDHQENHFIFTFSAVMWDIRLVYVLLTVRWKQGIERDYFVVSFNFFAVFWLCRKIYFTLFVLIYEWWMFSNTFMVWRNCYRILNNKQKIKFSIKDFFSKCGFRHLLKQWNTYFFAQWKIFLITVFWVYCSSFVIYPFNPFMTGANII